MEHRPPTLQVDSLLAEPQGKPLSNVIKVRSAKYHLLILFYIWLCRVLVVALRSSLVRVDPLLWHTDSLLVAPGLCNCGTQACSTS